MSDNKEKNESAASNYVFLCSQWQHGIMSLLNFIDDNHFISITGKPSDTNKHQLTSLFKSNVSLFSLTLLCLHLGFSPSLAVAYEHITNQIDFPWKIFF